MKRILWTLGLLLASTLAFALPSVDAVQAEVKAGHYAQAESMMQEVVAGKPKSARAHYIYAEILAHNGRFDEATKQARTAHELDPSVSFTDPARFRSFEHLLERQQAARSTSAMTSMPPVMSTPAAAPAPLHERGLPGWVWGIGVALVVWMLWRLFARRASRVAAPAYGGGYGGYGTGYGGAGGMPMQPGGGSGLLGTGIAAAGGFAAGMLAEKMLEGDHAHAAEMPAANRSGLQPGMFDDYGSAANDLEQRSIDFGGGGGDWGGDAGSGDAGGDFGSGSGSDW
jgi:hypothetical protein